MYTTDRVAVQAYSELISASLWAIAIGTHNWWLLTFQAALLYCKMEERCKNHSQSGPRWASSPAVRAPTRPRWKRQVSAVTYSAACKII